MPSKLKTNVINNFLEYVPKYQAITRQELNDDRFTGESIDRRLFLISCNMLKALTDKGLTKEMHKDLETDSQQHFDLLWLMVNRHMPFLVEANRQLKTLFDAANMNSPSYYLTWLAICQMSSMFSFVGYESVPLKTMSANGDDVQLFQLKNPNSMNFSMSYLNINAMTLTVKVKGNPNAKLEHLWLQAIYFIFEKMLPYWESSETVRQIAKNQQKNELILEITSSLDSLDVPLEDWDDLSLLVEEFYTINLSWSDLKILTESSTWTGSKEHFEATFGNHYTSMAMPSDAPDLDALLRFVEKCMVDGSLPNDKGFTAGMDFGKSHLMFIYMKEEKYLDMLFIDDKYSVGITIISPTCIVELMLYQAVHFYGRLLKLGLTKPKSDLTPVLVIQAPFREKMAELASSNWMEENVGYYMTTAVERKTMVLKDITLPYKSFKDAREAFLSH